MLFVFGGFFTLYYHNKKILLQLFFLNLLYFQLTAFAWPTAYSGLVEKQAVYSFFMSNVFLKISKLVIFCLKNLVINGGFLVCF